MSEFEIRQVRSGDWSELRAIRLEMLTLEPLAFTEPLEHARLHREAEWQRRADRLSAPDAPGFAVVAEPSGRWVGMARGDNDPGSGRAFVYSVYVAGSHRGCGAADAVMAAVEAWARRVGHADIYLLVHEDNGRARAFYTRRGYALTGARAPYPLDSTTWELEMRRLL